MSLISLQRRRPRVALFFSGAGSTLQALIDLVESLNVVCIFSSKETALGRLRGQRQGLSDFVFNFPQDFPTVLELLKEKKIDTVMLVGFMKIIPAEFVQEFKGLGRQQRIFNIHPSLLPNFKGLRAIENAFVQKAAMGVTIHDVVAEVDSGDFFKRQKSLNPDEVAKVNINEVYLWQRACEQQILRSWGSAVA